ncbi:MAG: serine protease [Proteobacteria bacterium]|nr:MAG: serine protease [Pseudomonadota bacterium]
MLGKKWAMKALTLPFAALLLFSSAGAHAAIFGADNRIDIGPNNPFRSVQNSVAVGILSSQEEAGPNGTINLVAPSNEGKMCATERFVKDPSITYACTAFLIAPDLLLTAGHCAVNVGISEHETKTYCKAYSWLFDYAPGFNGKTQTQGIDADKMYRCKETVYAVNEEQAPYRDFAIIRLDRPVLGRAPLKLSSEAIAENSVLAMVGHPMGMPAKVATNAKILVNDPAYQKMITTLDAMDGNSGSPVLNSKREVVGILVGGFPSDTFLTDEKNKCQALNRCDDNGLNCIQPDTDLKPFPSYQAVGSEVQKLEGVREILNRILP